MAEKSKRWFSGKVYGRGWGLPCSWEGWLVLLTYVVLLASPPAWVEPKEYKVYLLVITAALIGICMWKGGRRNG